MFSDLSQAARILDVDVAIYGAGPAGISLARVLAGRGRKVGLFEAGGFDPPTLDAQHPYAGENVGRPYDVLATRLRYFGGTTNHWGGWVRPLETYDFEPRDFQPISGWPFPRSELEGYYEGAMQLCEVPDLGMGLDVFNHDFGYEGYLHERHPGLVCKNFLFSPPTRFGQTYRSDVSESDDIQCFLNTTLTGLSAEDRAISQASLRDRNGIEVKVRAEQHVLAMGAIENARMLLHSRLANSSDYVGRCFSDHLGTTVAEAMVDGVNRYEHHRTRQKDQSLYIMPHLSLPDQLLREHELVNCGLVFLPSQEKDTPLESGIRQRIADADAQRVKLLVRMENTPNPNSRITLSNSRDPFGIPRVVLDWQVNRQDFESVERLGKVIEPMLSIAGARVRIRDEGLRERVPKGSFQAHHLGTTRMSEDPEQGVVNPDLRCHDLDNLYIAGSSVFPTYGFANPTLTLLALTLRLADHLGDAA